LSPFTFSDGFTVAVGDWICIPQQAMMHNPKLYRDPATFDAFRFIAKGSDKPDTHNKNTSHFTDASLEWLMWGSGKTVW
jgi:hypothetical protein